MDAGRGGGKVYHEGNYNFVFQKQEKSFRRVGNKHFESLKPRTID